MQTTLLHIAPYSIRIFLMAFWLYVALDKLWNLGGFHVALLRQPFPDHWANTLYWSLPVSELALALLFFLPKRRLSFMLSASLLLIFSIYIGTGLLGFYPKRPCGCASIFSGLTWEWHLVVNMLLFSLSILGWYLTGPTAPMDNRRIKRKQSVVLFRSFMILIAVPVYFVFIVFIRRFPRRFALFPGRPVLTNLNYTFVVLS